MKYMITFHVTAIVESSRELAFWQANNFARQQAARKILDGADTTRIDSLVVERATLTKAKKRLLEAAQKEAITHIGEGKP